MRLKEKYESSLLKFIFGIVVSTVITTTAVVHYYENNRLESEIRKHEFEKMRYEAELSSIKRNVSGSSRESFDIRTLYKAEDLPAESEYFAEEHFYALNMADWTYVKTTDIKLSNEVSGSESNANAINPAIRDFSSKQICHVWRCKPELIVEGHSTYQKIFPYISVHVYPVSAIKETLKIGLGLQNQTNSVNDDKMNPEHDNTEITSNTQSFDPKDNDQGIRAIDKRNPPGSSKINNIASQSDQTMLNKLDQLFEGDFAGILLALSLWTWCQNYVSPTDSQTNLLSIQKVGNVVYLSTLKKISAKSIGPNKLKHYYIHEEMFIISTPKQLVLVRDFIPNTDTSTRGKVFADVTTWLYHFRIEHDKLVG